MWEKDKKMKVTKEKQVNLPEDHPPPIVGNSELPLIIYRIYKILFSEIIKFRYFFIVFLFNNNQ